MKTRSLLFVVLFAGGLSSGSAVFAAGADSGFSVGVIDALEVDRLPVVKSRVAPMYPFAMRRAGVTGRVLVEFTVETDGLVRDVTAVESTRPEFEAAAVQAVSKWKFSPGIKNNREVRTRMRVPIVFSLDPNPPAQR